MSLTKLDVSLEEYEIGLSGAVPDRKDWSEPAMDRGILEFVALFSGIVFKYGGRIVHGCHPTFTPVILRQARLWAQDLRPEDIESMTDIAEFLVTKKVGDGGPADASTRNRSLSAMRRVLIDAQNVMVAVGGKMHSADRIVPGVAEEMTLAGEKGIPRFLIGGLGGFARKLAKELTPSALNNSLSHKVNVTLFGSDDVSACVNVLFEHLALSKALSDSALQPIKWNPGVRVILDHRDGTIDSEATQYILRANAV